MRYGIAYVSTFAIMVVLDVLWLRFASDVFFRPAVGDILTDRPNFLAAALFYVFFAAGLVYFAVSPAMKGASLGMALMNGALLGFLAYMSFDLTNLAILRLWSVKVSLIDIAWGTFVSGISAMFGFMAASFRA